ncbi:MAG: YvcK family protein [Actinomycetota bacterium]|nr:YvcK family protein [Actinomycetota bacterium]
MSRHDGRRSSPAIAAVGGGHGLAATLRAVRTFTDRVTAVVSVADDGGSSGRLRELFQVLAPGDLRKCLVALAEPGSLLAKAFTLRYAEEELAGHTLGNLVITAMMDVAGDPVAGLDEVCRLLGIKGRVLPATSEPVVLKAEAEAGPVAGQVAVMGTADIRRVSLVPAEPSVPPAVEAALAGADLVVVGPGSLFTSVLAAAAVPALRSAIAASPARTVYVCNLHPQDPETRGFDVAAHVAALLAHGIEPDVVLCDPGGLDVGSPAVSTICRPLARPNGLAHDPALLAEALEDLLD